MLAETVQEWTQEWKAQGLEEGLEKGLEKGRQEGEARILSRQLQHRFGEVPSWVQEKIAQADQAILEEWSLRFVNAQSLEEIFV